MCIRDRPRRHWSPSRGETSGSEFCQKTCSFPNLWNLYKGSNRTCKEKKWENICEQSMRENSGRKPWQLLDYQLAMTVLQRILQERRSTNHMNAPFVTPQILPWMLTISCTTLDSTLPHPWLNKSRLYWDTRSETGAPVKSCGKGITFHFSQIYNNKSNNRRYINQQ